MDEVEAELAKLEGILFEQSQRFIKYDWKEIFMIWWFITIIFRNIQKIKLFYILKGLVL